MISLRRVLALASHAFRRASTSLQGEVQLTPVISDDICRELSSVQSDKPVVVIVGRAGTGKTTLVRELLKNTKIKQAVIAPTGVAALNVGGQTIHSFLNIPPALSTGNELRPVRDSHQVFKHLERLIIDEVSMVRADLMDNIDRALQINKRNSLPFGGVQLVLVGDFLQLPPVVPSDEAEILSAMGYKTPYALSAHCLKLARPIFFELCTVHRQTDAAFIDLLANIRTGVNTEANIEYLNEKCLGKHPRDVVPVVLTGTNNAAAEENRDRFDGLTGDISVYEGVVVGKFESKKDRFPAPPYLELKNGARVMFVKNDPGKRWVNGSLGTITKLEKDQAWVCLDGTHKVYEVKRAKWEQIRYTWNQSTEQIERTVVGSYSQVPLQLAWAITIHKAQGLTLEDVRIDLKTGAFSDGQTYVALSRAKSFDGLSLAHPLGVADVKVNSDLLRASEYISAHARKF